MKGQNGAGCPGQQFMPQGPGSGAHMEAAAAQCGPADPGLVHHALVYGQSECMLDRCQQLQDPAQESAQVLNPGKSDASYLQQRQESTCAQQALPNEHFSQDALLHQHQHGIPASQQQQAHLNGDSSQVEGPDQQIPDALHQDGQPHRHWQHLPEAGQTGSAAASVQGLDQKVSDTLHEDGQAHGPGQQMPEAGQTASLASGIDWRHGQDPQVAHAHECPQHLPKAGGTGLLSSSAEGQDGQEQQSGQAGGHRQRRREARRQREREAKAAKAKKEAVQAAAAAMPSGPRVRSAARVVLLGQGADEQCAGYTFHTQVWMHPKITALGRLLILTGSRCPARGFCLL